jgi:hypothetical protein
VHFVNMGTFRIWKFRFRIYDIQWPIPVAAQSKAQVCGRALAGIVGSNPTGGMIFVSCTVFVLSGRGLCDGPIPRPEESYRMWCVLQCDQMKIQNPLHLL